jgi:hypothetical protein
VRYADEFRVREFHARADIPAEVNSWYSASVASMTFGDFW